MAKSKSVRPAKRTLNHLALLNLETARADDATRQFNEAQAAIKRMESEVEAANANMAEMGKLWKAAETHSKVNHQLLTDAREEIVRLRTDLAHSDAERRKLERDVLAQRAELAKLQPFNRILGAFPARGPIA